MPGWFNIHKSTNVIHHINKMKEKSHDHLNRGRRGFDKIQHLFMIKTLNKLGVEGMYLNTIKAYGKEKTTANILLNSEKLKAVPLISGRMQECPHLPLLFNIALEDGGIRQEKEIKCIQIRKEEVKLPLFADDMIIHVENPKDSTTTAIKNC